MEGWMIYSGLLNILLIEEGDFFYDFAKKNLAFKVFFVFVSLLSFVRNVKYTVALMGIYYSIKLFVFPFFKVISTEEEDSSLLGPKQQ